MVNTRLCTYCYALVLISVLMSITSAHAGAPALERLEILTQRIQSESDNGELYLRRAVTYADLNRVKEAFSDLDIASRLGLSVEAAFVRASIHKRLKEWSQAKDAYDRILARMPHHLDALISRGKVLEKLDQPALAEKDYLLLLGLKADLGIGDAVHLANFFASLVPSKVDVALDILDRKIRQTGSIPQLQYTAVQIESDRKNYQRAIARMQSLSPIIQSSPQWHVRVAELKMLDRNPQSASYHLHVAAELLEVRPDNAAHLALRNRISTLKAALL